MTSVFHFRDITLQLSSRSVNAFRQISGSNYTSFTDWRKFQYRLASAKTISSYLERAKAHSPDDVTMSYFVEVVVLPPEAQRLRGISGFLDLRKLRLVSMTCTLVLPTK